MELSLIQEPSECGFPVEPGVSCQPSLADSPLLLEPIQCLWLQLFNTFGALAFWLPRTPNDGPIIEVWVAIPSCSSIWKKYCRLATPVIALCLWTDLAHSSHPCDPWATFLPLRHLRLGSAHYCRNPPWRLHFMRLFTSLLSGYTHSGNHIGLALALAAPVSAIHLLGDPLENFPAFVATIPQALRL